MSQISIALVDDGHGSGVTLNLVIEIKGLKGLIKHKQKQIQCIVLWVPAVNNDRRWSILVEIMDMQDARAKLAEQKKQVVDQNRSWSKSDGKTKRHQTETYHT